MGEMVGQWVSWWASGLAGGSVGELVSQWVSWWASG